MSVFKPDIFNKLKDKGYVYDSHEYGDSLMAQQRHDAITPPSYAPVDNLTKAIHAHCLRFNGEERKVYEYAKISTATTNEIFSSRHYFNILSIYFITSVKKTYPEIDFSEFEKHLQNAGQELNQKVRTEPLKDNTIMICALLGIIEKLI